MSIRVGCMIKEDQAAIKSLCRAEEYFTESERDMDLEYIPQIWPEELRNILIGARGLNSNRHRERTQAPTSAESENSDRHGFYEPSPEVVHSPGYDDGNIKTNRALSENEDDRQSYEAVDVGDELEVISEHEFHTMRTPTRQDPDLPLPSIEEEEALGEVLQNHQHRRVNAQRRLQMGAPRASRLSPTCVSATLSITDRPT